MSSTNTQATSETLAFPLHLSPIGVLFTVVPALVLVFTALTLATTKLPILLMLLIVLAAAAAAVLLRSAVDEMGPVSVEWSAQGVTVRRLLGQTSYPWSQVERVELYDPGATFGDWGRHEEKRAAIGLYIRDPLKKNRPQGDPPDVLVISRAGEAGEKIPKLNERLSNARRYGGKDARKIGGAQPAGDKRQSRQFRRTANAA